MHPDPPEPSDEETFRHDAGNAVAPKTRVTVELDNHDSSQINGMIVAAVVEQSLARASEGIDALLLEKVSEAADAVIEKKLGEELDKVLAAGWTLTDQWGNKRSHPKSLRELIIAALEHREGSYRDHPTKLEKLLDAAVQRCFDKEMQGVVSEAKARLKKMLDEKMSAQFTDAVKQAFGIR